MNTLFMILCLALCVATATLFIYLRVTHVGLHGFWGKLGASTMFVIGGFVALMLKVQVPLYLYFVLLGLTFGRVGDVLLELKIIYKPHDAQYTNIGILAFALNHICYMVALTLYSSAVNNLLTYVFVSLAVGAVLATLIVANSGSMGVDFGKFKFPATAYSFVLCIDFAYSVALAIASPKLIIFAVALLFFLASDAVLSLIYWGGRDNKMFNIINLSTYYVAQILIVAFMFLV